MPNKVTGMLFQDDLVRAILKKQKTQTRRKMRLEPENHNHLNYPHADWKHEAPLYIHETKLSSEPVNRWYCKYCGCGVEKNIKSPYGLVDDIIYVREAWRIIQKTSNEAIIEYRSSKGYPGIESTKRVPVELTVNYEVDNKRWRPSLLMPKWASRINLVITHVGIEPLHNISIDDARCEGFDTENPLLSFQNKWIETGGIWDVNPSIWVYHFKLM